MSAPKYCDDPDHCTYSDCPTAFCDRGAKHSFAAPTWLDGITAPKDGAVIVAVGRVISSDEISTWVDSFVADLTWHKDESGYEGWHYGRDNMTVARSLDDKVIVDYWIAMPSNAESSHAGTGR